MRLLGSWPARPLAAILGLGVLTGNPLLIGAGIGLVSYLVVEGVTGQTPTWQGAATATVMGALGIAGATVLTAVAGAIVGEGLGAFLIGGTVAGAGTGILGAMMYDWLEGRSATQKQLEEAAFFGAVFGLAGGYGEYGTSAEASGGVGFGSSFDEAAGNAFDLVVGTLAAATAHVLGP